jgi:hypothetical protein
VKKDATGVPWWGVAMDVTERTRWAQGSGSMFGPSWAPGVSSSRASRAPLEWPIRWMGPSPSTDESASRSRSARFVNDAVGGVRTAWTVAWSPASSAASLR